MNALVTIHLNYVKHITMYLLSYTFVLFVHSLPKQKNSFFRKYKIGQGSAVGSLFCCDKCVAFFLLLHQKVFKFIRSYLCQNMQFIILQSALHSVRIIISFTVSIVHIIYYIYSSQHYTYISFITIQSALYISFIIFQSVL